MSKQTEVIKHAWYLFDASKEPVGRFATRIARILTGTYKPTYTHNVDCGDYAVVINASNAVFTGKKWEQKVYRKHTG